jgi:hypothetical protein
LSFVNQVVTQDVGDFGPFDDVTIREAVALWFEDPDAATATYGFIGEWDTSQVTSFEALFYRNVTNNTFNEPLSMWQMGNVTTMRSMFFNCTSFNQDISGWNTLCAQCSTVPRHTIKCVTRYVRNHVVIS